MKKNISTVIFWAAIWGIEESTLGHFLHIATLNIGWLLWFPLSYFFMNMVYKKTGKINMILLTSIIAAAIKLLDFFMTTNSVIIICPALSIILEGISYFTALNFLRNNKLAEIFSASLLWRVLFLACLFFIPSWIMSSYPYKNALSVLRFTLFEGLLNSIFIYGFVIFANKINEIGKKNKGYIIYLRKKMLISMPLKESNIYPAVSISILFLALVIQWVL